MEIRADSTTGSRALRWLVTAAVFAFAIGCGDGGGTEDTHSADAVDNDIAADTDEGIADQGRDEQSGETVGDDTPGDAADPAEVQDVDQDAHVSSGIVEVLPEEVVMRCSATTKVALAMLTVKNVGDADLSVSSIQIKDPTCDASSCLFTINAIQLHDPDGIISTGTGPIKPDGFAAVELKFELLGPQDGEYAAVLEIVSDSVENPVVVVPLRATIVHSGVCRVQLVPANTNFGVVPVGFPKTAEVRLINTGTASCKINAVKIADCQKNGEDLDCPDPLAGDDSTVFTIAAGETLVGVTVEAGQQTNMHIVYTPPVAGEDTTTYGAILSVQFEDPAGETYVLPSCGGTGAACTPNIGGAIILDTNVYPPAVDFGLVRSGCGTGQAKVCYYNTAETPMPVKVDASQCGPEFVFEDLPADWDDAIKGVPWCVEVDYWPTDAGQDTCTVLFNENGTPVTSQGFTLGGEGTTDDSVTDVFSGHSGQTEFDIGGMPVSTSVVVVINDFECQEWTVGGDYLDATIVVGESCPVQHLDNIEISYDLDCVAQSLYRACGPAVTD